MEWDAVEPRGVTRRECLHNHGIAATRHTRLINTTSGDYTVPTQCLREQPPQQLR